MSWTADELPPVRKWEWKAGAVKPLPSCFFTALHKSVRKGPQIHFSQAEKSISLCGVQIPVLHHRGTPPWLTIRAATCAVLAEKGGETSANITDRGVISSGARLEQFVEMKSYYFGQYFILQREDIFLTYKGFLGETAFCANYRQGLISKLQLCWRGNWRCVQLARLRMEHSRGEEGGTHTDGG